jgi:pimeloyl-ACP methyl ester carboxylesterase
VRGLRYHLHQWGEPALATRRPPAAGDAARLDGRGRVVPVRGRRAGRGRGGFDRWVIAPDWRGFGLTQAPGADSYWFPDYLGDLDALLRALGIAGPIDLLGHSMGGNVVMSYAGVRPQRVRRLVNLEGFGMPPPSRSRPRRLAQWLDELKPPAALRGYASWTRWPQRLRNDPLLTPDKAAWLAPHWAAPAPTAAGRSWATRRTSASTRCCTTSTRCWRPGSCITAPVLWVEGDQTDTAKWWGHRYPRSEFDARLAVVPQVHTVRWRPAATCCTTTSPRRWLTTCWRFLAPG